MKKDHSIGIEIRGLYDGVVIWVEPDGTVVNRFAGEPGWEELAAKVDQLIEQNGEEYRNLAHRFDEVEQAEVITERESND